MQQKNVAVARTRPEQRSAKTFISRRHCSTPGSLGSEQWRGRVAFLQGIPCAHGSSISPVRPNMRQQTQLYKASCFVFLLCSKLDPQHWLICSPDKSKLPNEPGLPTQDLALGMICPLFEQRHGLKSVKRSFILRTAHIGPGKRCNKP